MLNISIIKQAVIEVNHIEFQEPQDSSRLYLDLRKSISLRYNPDFVKVWYGSLYESVIGKIVDKYSHHGDQSKALKNIVNASGSNYDRGKIFQMCRDYSGKENDKSIDKLIDELTKNIKSVVRNHCLHFDKTDNNDYDSYASAVLNAISSFISDNQDDRRTHLFHLNKIFELEQDIYKKLALYSIIALIPNDATEEQMDEARRFANVIHTKFTTQHYSAAQRANNNDISPKKEIKKEDIWAAGKNWYEETKVEGNRFSKLFPETELLPLAGTIPIYAHSTNNQEKPLIKLINETTGHLYLIGEGGIGKTTALYSIMENAYNNSKGTKYSQVPLFIELSCAYKSEDFDLDRGRSEFILHTVQKQLQTSLRTKADIEEQIEEEFQKDIEEPEYVLLLDGLNEVSREEIKGHVILQMVVAEIMYIMANYKNVRVILTSRSEEKLSEEVKSLYLSGINPKRIEAYLNEKKVSSIRIKKTIQNAQLMEILRIPLFLIMYAELKGEDEILSRGEILHFFFSKTNKDLYSERNRIETINTEFAKETGIDRSEGSKDCITPHMLNFILEFIMPQIAWNMAKENEFQINRTGIKKAVKQVLTDKTETSFISEYGIEFFGEYLTGEDENIRTTAERIKKVFGADGSEGMDSISSGVLKCLTKQFGLLVTNDYKEYEVLHQHIRDYFAALYHINRLKLAAYINEQGYRDEAIECLSEMGKEPLPGQVLVFIGEALGELHNVPELNEETNEWIKKEPEKGTERDLINRNFDIFRGSSNDVDNYAVWNLFQILKLVCKDLSGLDLSGLDLRSCRANGYRLGNRTLAVNLNNAIISEEFFLPTGHSSGIHSAVYSPDGKYILTASFDKTAKVWDAKTYKEIPGGTLEGHKIDVSSAVYSPDGKYILTASYDGTAKVWDAKTFKEIPRGTLEGHMSGVTSAVYSPDGKYILTTSWDKTAKVWDAKTFKMIPGGTLKGHTSIVNSAAYSPDGKYILTASEDKTAKVWDAKTYKEIPRGTLEGHTREVKSAAYSPDGKYILTASWDKTAKVWDAKTYKEIPGGTLKGHNEYVNSAVYSPDGKYILTSSLDGTAKVWDAKTFKEIPGGTLEGHTSIVNSAVYSSDGKYILTASWYGTAKVWDAKTYKEIPGGTLEGHTNGVNSAVYSPDGKYILTASWDKTAKVWDAKTYKKILGGTLEGHTRSVNSAAYSPDGKYILTASDDNTAKVWDAKTYKEIPGGTLKGHTGGVISAVYSPDGKYILTASDDNTAKVWDAKTYKEIPGGTLEGHTGGVTSAVYSPDGKYILTASWDRTAKVWDAKTYKEIPGGTLKGHTSRVNSAVYSPDGKYILTSSWDRTAKVWDVKTYKEIPGGTLESNKKEVESAVYSPDGKYILTASGDGTVKVWDAKTYKKILGGTLKGYTNKVISAAYSPDGKYILTSSWDGTAMVWDAKTFRKMHIIYVVAGFKVRNVDIRDINESSHISIHIKKLLSDYGAIVE